MCSKLSIGSVFQFHSKKVVVLLFQGAHSYIIRGERGVVRCIARLAPQAHPLLPI